MLRVALISDTHGYIDEPLLKAIAEADEVWHAGDIGNKETLSTILRVNPVVAVFGNIDGNDLRTELSEDVVMEREGLKILMTHIGGYPGKYSSRARKLIEQHNPQIFVCGHSHILKVMKDERYQMLTLNPGAAGVHGFHIMKTILRFTLNKGKIEKMEAVELGRRGEIK